MALYLSTVSIYGIYLLPILHRDVGSRDRSSVHSGSSFLAANDATSPLFDVSGIYVHMNFNGNNTFETFLRPG
jgi:hypothetical protein